MFTATAVELAGVVTLSLIVDDTDKVDGPALRLLLICFLTVAQSYTLGELM